MGPEQAAAGRDEGPEGAAAGGDDIGAAARVLQPVDTAEAARLLGEARTEGRPVVIRGRGTKAHWLPAPPPEAWELDTARLSQKGELRPENLTGRFAAGTSLSEVARQLAASGLWLPLEDLDSGGRATVGGVLAAGLVNPLRLGHGLPRDWVLGLTVVDGEGRVLRLGGELVKNVAGYNLVHLHVGAWGRLGLVTEATVRLLPLPGGDASLSAQYDSVEEAEAGLRASLRGRARPASLEAEVRPEGVHVLARILGDPAGLTSRLEVLAGDLGSAGPTEIISGEDALAARLEYEAGWRAAGADYPWRCRLSVAAPGLITARGLVAAALGEGAAPHFVLAGQAGSGVYRLFWRDEAGPLPVLRRLAARLTGFVTAEGAAARLLAAPPGAVADWVSFPPRAPRDQDELERRILEALAPGVQFNPHLAGHGCGR